jgi:hypothetical protein
MKSQAQAEADRRYKQNHREEINRKERERYANAKANPKTHAPALISVARVRAEEGLDKPRREPCTCNDYTHCMRCRNAEKERAAAAGEIPVYRLKVIARIVAIGD